MKPRLTPDSSAPESPIMVTQHTSERVLGIDGKRYLRYLRAHPEIPKRRIGWLVQTQVNDWLLSPRRPANDVPKRPWSLDDAVAEAVA